MSAIYVHIVFATKHRTPWLRKPIRERVHPCLARLARSTSSECLRVGGTSDHVHLALRLGRTDTVARLVEKVKAHSTPWIQDLSHELGAFRWQSGYSCFSFGHERLDGVLRYIDNQEQHHAKTTFAEEFAALLAEHQLTLDPRYTWD